MRHTPGASNPWHCVQRQDNKGMHQVALICSACWRARMRTQTQPMVQLQQQPPVAFTTASTLGTTYGGATTIPSEISTAINQLAANQLAIQQQMAAKPFAANAPAHHTQFQIPPIQNMGQQPFAEAAQGSFNTGRGSGGSQRGGRGHGCTGSRGGGRGRGLFAQQFPGGFGGIPPFVNCPPAAVVPPTGARVNAPFQSNTTTKMQIGTYAGHVGLTWRMDILLQRAPPIGTKQTIRWDSPTAMPSNGLTKAMHHAPKGCTKISFLNNWGSSERGGRK
jgi:hypothetical protein